MGLEITTTIENDKTVLTLSGKLTNGGETEKLRNAICDLTDQGVTDIVVDLQKVTTIDSTALGELAAARWAVANRGGNLELRNLPSKVQDMLAISNFPNFPDSPGGFAF